MGKSPGIRDMTEKYVINCIHKIKGFNKIRLHGFTKEEAEQLCQKMNEDSPNKKHVVVKEGEF